MALHWLALLVSPGCGYPKWFAFFMLPQNFFIFFLFYDFYRKTYQKKPEIQANGTNNEANSKNKYEQEKFLNHEKPKNSD